MEKTISWSEFRNIQRKMWFVSLGTVLIGSHIISQGGVAVGVLWLLVALLFAGMGVFPTKPKDMPKVKIGIVCYTIFLFVYVCFLQTLS